MTEARSAQKGGRVIPLRGEEDTPPTGQALLGKVIAAAKEVAPLVKRDEHDEGFSFVSIDDYYEKAAKVLLNHGVSWSATEIGVGPISPEFDALGWRFSFSLYDDAGNYIPDFGRVTVPHDVEGPQTAGKVMSYAEKVFLRQLLKLVTGEPDADVSPTKKGRGARRRVDLTGIYEEAAPEPGMDGDVLASLLDAISNADSIDAINLAVEKNKRQILLAKAKQPDIYSRVATAREKRMSELEQLDE